MNPTLQCDLAIIGAGSAGLSIAAVAAPLGLKVILIESNKMGGDCLNSGCVPSKSFIAAAKSAHHMVNAAKFGIEPHTPQIDFNKVMNHVQDVINTIAPHDSIERFTQLGAKVIQTHAQFIDEKTIQAGDHTIEAHQFVIATGSTAAIPPIPGLTEVPYLTNETIFNLREKPSHLIVIGGGPIGCELAQAFLYLGVKVTLLEAFTILPRDEPELVAIIRDTFKKEGLAIYEKVKVLSVHQNNSAIEINIENNGQKETITGSHLLVAAGRKANVDHLNLEKAKVAFTPKGIQVDKRLRTTNKSIFAIGDIAGPYQFTHMANYQAGIVIRNAIFKLPASVDYRAVPWVTYVYPELAHVGMTEADAINQHLNIRVLTLDLSRNDRAQTERETTGKIKIIVTQKGKILGASILGAHAGELILPWTLLIKHNKTLRDLTDTIIAYPTLSEISKQVASEFYRPKLFSNTVKRLVNLVKWI